ncbi:MAG: outer membrane lipoprotein-sorting protein [Sandaracinaceae bacterium]
MNRTAFRFALLLAALAMPLLAATAPAQTDRGREIARQIQQNNRGYRDMSAEIRMTLRSADGHETQREMRLRVLEREAANEGDLSMILFDSPGDVRGTALLSRAGVGSDDEQWLYLPALHRVRRISTSNMTGPFVGSEFSYEDITGGEVDKYDWRLLGEAACGEEQCSQLETRPRYSGSGYSRRVVLVDGQHRVRSVEFFDRQDHRLKTLTYDDYRRFGRFWRSTRWTMVNHQNHKTTVLTLRNVRFGNGFSESDFTRAALERAR